jgi:hypothetical protein
VGVIARKQLPDVSELVLPTQKRGCRDRQVRPVQRLQRRESIVAELEDPLRRAQVLEPVLAQIEELVRVDERRRHRRHEHLTAVTDCGNASRAVDIGADIALHR